MSIQLAIATLQQYRLCKKMNSLQSRYSYEINRRIAYINNLVLQLSRLTRKQSSNEVLLLAGDIRHCLLQNYYPLLPTEQESDSFNFVQTLEDVAQLLEIETSSSIAA